MKTYTTSRGIEIEFRPVSKELMLRFSVANPQPEIPTYELKSEITGTVTRIPLDEKSLREKPEQFTPEQHTAWKVYVEKNADFIMRFIKFFCLYIKVKDGLFDEWRSKIITEYEFLEVPFPNNELANRFDWLTSEVLATVEDYENVAIGVFEASGVPADLLQQVSDSFRGDIQRDSDHPTGDSAEQVESVPELDRSAGNVAFALDAKPMGKPKRTRSHVGTRHTGNA